MRNPRRKKSPYMIKEWMLILLGLATLGIAMALPRSASAVSLKTTSLVDDNTLTLGDVFDGLESGGDKVLGAAPQPGNDMVLNARTLLRIALAMDLNWRPATSADQVVIRRAATLVPRAHVEDVIKTALSAQGIIGNYDVIFPEQFSEIVLPQNMPAQAEILSLNVSADQQSFQAEIAAPSKEKPVKQITVNGRLMQMVDVPVLRDNMQNGSMIRASDIEMIALPAHTVNHDVLLSTEALMGMTPRRMVLAGKPVKANDVQAPRIIQRGELVTMVFNQGGLSLTAQGKAMEDGAKGDVIRVTNASSSKTIEAQITNFKEVKVVSF